jgi:hypothetical protein
MTSSAGNDRAEGTPKEILKIHDLLLSGNPVESANQGQVPVSVQFGDPGRIEPSTNR